MTSQAMGEVHITFLVSMKLHPCLLTPANLNPLPCSNFTQTAVNLSLTLLNAGLDLLSFSGILFSIYPPLFAALVAYSVTGTAFSLWLGKVGCSVVPIRPLLIPPPPSTVVG